MVKISHILFFMLLITAGIGLYMLLIFVGALLSTKAAPRVDMYYCEVHGPIPRDGVITFLGADSCGICFHEKLRKAERGRT